MERKETGDALRKIGKRGGGGGGGDKTSTRTKADRQCWLRGTLGPRLMKTAHGGCGTLVDLWRSSLKTPLIGCFYLEPFLPPRRRTRDSISFVLSFP